MLTKRIIPCLDVKQGRVVKGIGFKELKDAGDPVELALKYYEQGADELVFLDITASYEGRGILVSLVERIADVLYIPFTVGGGIRSIDDIRRILRAGADKVSINTAAVQNPSLIKEASEIFGSQCIVVSIDVKRVYTDEEQSTDKTVVKMENGYCWWDVYIYGGKQSINMDALKWAERAVKLGAGELLVSSLDFDGTKQGYDLILLKELSRRVSVPIIASSGAGDLDHILKALTIGGADAALAASIFHYGQYTVGEVKQYLAKHGVPVRL